MENKSQASRWWLSKFSSHAKSSQTKLKIKLRIWYSDWLNFKDSWISTKVVMTLAGKTWVPYIRWGRLGRCLYRFWLPGLFWTWWMCRSGFPSSLWAGTQECWVRVGMACRRGSWSPVLLLLSHLHPIIIVTSFSLAKIITFVLHVMTMNIVFYKAN